MLDEDYQKLTASVLVAVVSAVVVSVTLPLRRNAGTLPESTDRTREVVFPTGAISAATNTCTHRKEEEVGANQACSDHQMFPQN